MKFGLSITFLSDWQVGSGLGDGARADAILARDARGLLYLPGRAIKGALRESAHRLALVRPDLAAAETRLFGVDCRPEYEGAAMSFNQPGLMRVSQGRLPEEIEVILLAAEPATRALWVADLTLTRSMTALTPSGVAQAHSLRTLECGLPSLAFQAELTLPAALPGAESWLLAYLRALCALTRSLGGHRSRGLGRCRFTLDQEELPGPVEIPPAFDFPAAAKGR